MSDPEPSVRDGVSVISAWSAGWHPLPRGLGSLMLMLGSYCLATQVLVRKLCSGVSASQLNFWMPE